MPIYHAVEPRSKEWFDLRLGKPTSSEFARIYTPGGAESKQWEDYLHRLLAERIMGRQIEDPATQWMDRGSELEDEAIKAYEFQMELETAPGGVVTTEDGRIGTSPDRLIGDCGILEIKIPKPNTQVAYLLTGRLEDKYKPQLQGQLWITDREFVNIVSYSPDGLPARIMVVARDDKYIKGLSEIVTRFADLLDVSYQNLETQYGPFKRPDPPEASEGGVTDEDADMLIEAYTREGRFGA